MFGVDRIVGLPVHPLVVHLAVVLVPLAAISFILTGLRADWRHHYAFIVAVTAGAGAAAAFVAAQSGGSLRRSIRAAAQAAGGRADFGGHPGNGNLAEIFALLFALAAIGFWLSEYRADSLNAWPWLSPALYIVGSSLGVLALLTMVIAGHSGAVLVWKDLGNYVATR